MTRRELGIIAATFLAQAVAIGTTIGAFSLFVRPVSEDFGASTLAISAGLSLITLMLGLSGIVVGGWLDRGSPRRVMFTGAAIMIAALFLASQATALWQLALACLLTGVGIPMLGPLTTATVIGKAFDATRGRALGIANTGMNVGGFACALLAGMVIESSGWREALRLFAGLVLVIAVPAIALGIPSSLGSRDHADSPAPDADAGWTPRALFGSRTFLLCGIALGVTMGTNAGWSAHAAPFLRDLGGSTRMAGVFVALTQGVALLGTFGFGFFADRVGSAQLLIGLITAQIAAFALCLAVPALGVVSVALVFLGMMGGGLMPLFAHLLAERFGAASLGRTLGLANVFLLPFGFGLPMVGGAIRDAQGSYSGLLALCIAILACAIGLLVTVTRAPARGPLVATTE